MVKSKYQNRYSIRFLRYVLSPLLSISLTACGNPNEVPKVNPNPQKQVRIHGVFPFDKEMVLRFEANYVGMNKSCDEVDRVFGLIEAHRSKKLVSVPLNLIRLEGNQYEVYYYQDYLLPGYCDFTFAHISEKTYWSKSPTKEGGPQAIIQSESGDEVNISRDCSFQDNTKQGWGEDAIKELGTQSLSCHFNRMYVPFDPVLSKKATELEFNYFYKKDK